MKEDAEAVKGRTAELTGQAKEAVNRPADQEQGSK